ncbi:MAG: hypothetical protein IT555_14895 [Acetobacteraceae bacterium]|nr:hypothetical protein [Acetobacteraceae bacterium]
MAGGPDSGGAAARAAVGARDRVMVRARSGGAAAPGREPADAASMGVAPAGVAPVGVAPVGVAPVGVAPVGVDPLGGGPGLERGEEAGLPEFDEVFQAAEEAREEGHEQGVQAFGQPYRARARRGGGAQAGDPGDQRGLGY